MNKTTTDSLMDVLQSARPSDLDEFIKQHPENEYAFSDYMRARFKEKNIRQSEVFSRINISYGYGYKLISGEKRTRHRDLILELCLAAGFSLDEAQRALKLYRMSELYPKVPRDAVFIIAFNQGITDIDAVDKLMEKHGLEPLYKTREA